MKTLAILILLVIGFSTVAPAQERNWREATLSEALAGTAGSPVYISPRRLKAAYPVTYYVTSTNIFGTTNTSGGVFSNNAMTFTLTTGVYSVRGSLHYHNSGSGGVASEPAFPAGARALGGWTTRLSGDGANLTPFYRLWPSGGDWYQAYNTGTDVGSIAQFDGIVSVTGTAVFAPVITAQTLVPTNPPWLSTNSFIMVQKL